MACVFSCRIPCFIKKHTLGYMQCSSGNVDSGPSTPGTGLLLTSHQQAIHQMNLKFIYTIVTLRFKKFKLIGPGEWGWIWQNGYLLELWIICLFSSIELMYTCSNKTSRLILWPCKSRICVKLSKMPLNSCRPAFANILLLFMTASVLFLASNDSCVTSCRSWDPLNLKTIQHSI